MTSIFSAIAMPKGGRFLRKPDFLKSRQSGEGLSDVPRKPVDIEELLDTNDMEEKDPDLSELNTALCALVDIFPDVQPDVFREMLLNLSDQSRLEVVTEHLLRNGAQYIQGRYRKKAENDKAPPSRHVSLSQDDTFRSESYKRAVKDVLYHEFKSLSHSSIRAVLAEHNYSYTLARPTLQHLSSKSWRFTISSLFSRKRLATTDLDSHSYVEWLPDPFDPQSQLPYLKRTGDLELDRELYNTYIAPVLDRQKQNRLDRDEALANEMNETEAEEAGALFDCECCFTPSTFEQISTCDTEAGHYICFRCIKLAANEALYGQGWARNIDLQKSSLRCLAPSVPECHGCITSELVQRALCTEKDGARNWQKLQERVASENLIKSRIPLLRCPFCAYAELDEPMSLRFRDPVTLASHLIHRLLGPARSLGALLFICVYPLVFVLLHPLLLLTAILGKSTYARIQASRTRVVHRRRGLKFTCQSPTCGQSSCTNCSTVWSDPHTCHEMSLQSLRQCIETATTSSIKRTCPKCHLSFVKSDGCNKLVCNCGYTMCYVCRQEIGKEGYGHFCQHFREQGGRCTECERCDLYIVEDEEGTIRKAAMQAEKEWLEREGKSKGDDGDKYGTVVHDVLSSTDGGKRRNYEAWLDSFMEMTLE